MAQFTIYGKLLSDIEIQALKVLIHEAGGPKIDEITVATDIGDPDPDVEDAVVILLGTPEACVAHDLEASLKKLAGGPQRAIWVWPEGAEPSELPAPVSKYAYSCIPWDAEKLCAVASDDDVPCFETATGTQIPKVPTERNLCVEEMVKPK